MLKIDLSFYSYEDRLLKAYFRTMEVIIINNKFKITVKIRDITSELLLFTK